MGQWCRTHPLLKTMDITPMSLSVGIENLDLLRRCLLNDSISQWFYTDLLLYLENDQQHAKHKLLEEYNMKNGQNGLVDSLSNLLNHHCPNNRYFVELLLRTF